MGKFKSLMWALSRRKPMDVSEAAPTDLHRCLNTLDLTAMGVGATVGLGLYVITGEVAAEKAGPGVVLSFMIAAIASTLSALCYAEFAAKVPKSGSAYAYSYITVGEFVAFVIGWNLTLEHVIGTSTLARGYSRYLGFLFGKLDDDQTVTISWLPDFLQGYLTHFDPLSFVLTILVTGLLLLGVKVSSKFQTIFAGINLCVVGFAFTCGLFKADFHNWNLSKEELPSSKFGEGGFLPFGITGVIAGAGTCFFAFVGFDGIAAAAEEVKNPRKAIPNSILWTSVIIFIIYSAMSTMQTLIWPYWDQKQDAPLPYIFDKLDMQFARWTVLVGVLAGLSTSFVGGFLPLPRILYAMARDGIIYRALAIVNKRFKVPFLATIVGGILIAFMASMLNVSQLADMLSIGTLAAYSLVSVSVLLLRYEYRAPTDCENPLPITYQDHQASKEALFENRKRENITLATNGALTLGKKPNGTSKDSGKQEALELSRTSSNKSTNTGSVVSCSVSNATVATLNGHADSSTSITDSNTSRSLISLFMEGTRGPNNEIRRPDQQTTHVSRVIILILIVVTTLLDFALTIYGPTLYLMEPKSLWVCGSLLAATLLIGFLLDRLPVAESSTHSFEVPMVPTIPLFSVIINTYLMLNLSVMTWIRFGVWMAIGFFIYFTYGIFESTGYKDSRCD